MIKFIDEILKKELESINSSLEMLETAVKNHPSVKTSIHSNKGQKEILEKLKVEKSRSTNYYHNFKINWIITAKS